ncbi:N-acetyltransferase [Virgisporangium aliadipatigenens]|uniref:N-acetyltransferase n=1 Tax=Virgisporangium aliadipatigenens TaxID=741659 RepID=A0A8J3YLU3_9ACTN|nr:GNAT family N-acetyltransferase [Virgisporangium aliadipatigenens]GIJ47566.1 N-acetyltransferase [Virgisporangium aliadipatigenens]
MTFHPMLLAHTADAHVIAATVAVAFKDLDVARWLVPDDDERQAVLYRNFRIHVEHALEYGQVWTVPDHRGAAVWFARNGDLPAIDDYENRMTRACGPYAANFRALDAAFDAAHPARPHHHLAFLAVDPYMQGRGLGSALLEQHLIHLDLTPRPVGSYLEASSTRARELYLRYGYVDHGPPIRPADGVELWPMWRDPHPDRRFPPAV